MSLHNTESSNGYIEATDRDGYAISNPIIQDTGSNISTSSSTADTLVSDTEIVDGDILVIQLDDGSYNEFIVTSITGSGPWTVDTSSVTNGEVPDIVYKKETFESSFTSIKNISAKYEHINIADGSGIDVLRTTEEIRDGDKLVIVLNDNSINEMAASSVTKSVKPTYVGLDSGYPEENICALTIDGLNTYTTKFISCSGITSFFISASQANRCRIQYQDNGVCGIRTDLNPSNTPLDKFYINIEQGHDNFRLYLSYDNASWIDDVTFYSIYETDTTSITNGETPSKVYRVDETLKFNNTEPVLTGNNYILTSYNPPIDYIAYYKLETDASDETGNYNGTNSGATFDGQSASFDGVDGIAEYIANSSCTLTTSLGSVSLWYKITANHSVAQSYNIFYGYHENANRFYIGFNTSADTLGFGYGDKQNVSIDSGIDLKRNEFVHVVIIFNEGFFTAYQNNINVFTDTYTKSPNALMQAIGTYYDKPTNSYNADFQPYSNIGKVRIYNRALTSSEVENIYYKEYNDFYDDVILNNTQTFNDLNIDTREVETTVQMSATGNKCTEVKFDIYRNT